MSSVYVSMILGKSDAKVQGTAFFDNVSLSKLNDATEFNAAYSSIYVVDEDGNATVDADGKYVQTEDADKYLLTNRVIRADDAKSKDDDHNHDHDHDEKKTGNNLTWLLITSIVIGGILVIVIVVMLIRKFVPKNLFKRKKKVEYSRKEISDKDDNKSTDTEKTDTPDFKD